MIAKVLLGVGLLALLFIVYCIVLYLRQDNLLFYRVANDPVLFKQWRAYRVEIPAGDTFIEGWWADNLRDKSGPVVIYFGGNAEDVLYTADSASSLTAARILFTNYRGYGMTPGKPSQQALFADALTNQFISRALVQRTDSTCLEDHTGKIVGSVLERQTDREWRRIGLPSFRTQLMNTHCFPKSKKTKPLARKSRPGVLSSQKISRDDHMLGEHASCEHSSVDE